MTKNATILLSGGIDSACCAKLFADEAYALKGVFVDFGQPASGSEKKSSRAIANLFDVELEAVTVRSRQKFEPGEVRGRNAFLVNTALMHTHAENGLIVIGIHAGTPYYDCSPSFFDRMGGLVAECTDGRFQLAAPFLTWTKSEVYDFFRNSGIALPLTYSCEAGVKDGCGRCASCLDRATI